MKIAEKIKAVAIGGGTGTQVVISGLRKYPVDLSAVITVADSGGSTGRLRDEFGFQPVGDLRQALAALASDGNHDWIRKLLLYRFSKGSGLEGHNLGNLLLTALQDMAGNTPQALEIAHSIFRLDGNIYPVTTENIHLVVEYDDGTIEIGESVLDEKHGGQKIVSLRTSPHCSIYENARQAIIDADSVIIGPGDLYGSILPNLVVSGITETFAETKAKIIFIMNLMTRYTQTHTMSAQDHLDRIEKCIGRHVDYVIMSNSVIPEPILSIYASQHEFPVIDNLGNSRGIIREDLVKPVLIVPDAADKTKRSYLRHDSKKLATQIMKLSLRKS